MNGGHEQSRPGSDREESGRGGVRRWLPPVPTEHGARAMVGVALLTPAAVALRQGIPPLDRIAGFVLLAVLAVVVLAFREAVQRRLRAPPGHQRRFEAFAAAEALVIVALVGGLVAVAGRSWLAALVVIPGVLGDVAIRRYGWPVPLGGELSGILAISLAVPAGGALLTVGGDVAVGLLWVVFVTYHVEGLVRVKTAVRRRRGNSPDGVLGSVAFHGVVLALAVGGVRAGRLGFGVPVVFAVATAWAAWLASREEIPATRTLGLRERWFSALFVLAAPWFL